MHQEPKTGEMDRLGEGGADTTQTAISPLELAVIVPALNEEAGIENVVRGLRQALPGAEILVIDDGSSDRTGQLASQAGATVLRHRQNRGYGASLKTGIRHTRREYLLLCDADGQHRIEDILKVLAAAPGYDMVVGARSRESHAPWVRRPGKWLLRLFADFLAGERLPDLNSGLRLMRRDVILRYLHLMPTGFSFSTTSTFAFLKTQRDILWIPIVVDKRVGQSSVRQWKHGPQTLLLILRITVLFEPLKIFLSAAAVLALLACGMLVADLRFSHGTSIGNTTILLSVSALMVFLFGLVCDQVSSLRREKHE